MTIGVSKCPHCGSERLQQYADPPRAALSAAVPVPPEGRPDNKGDYYQLGKAAVLSAWRCNDCGYVLLFDLDNQTQGWEKA